MSEDKNNWIVELQQEFIESWKKSQEELFRAHHKSVDELRRRRERGDWAYGMYQAFHGDGGINIENPITGKKV